jgi:hypothetical protein
MHEHCPSDNRGRRECRTLGASAASCAVVVTHTSVVTTVTPEIIRHSPRNGFNGLLRALPGDRACLPPSSADNSATLTPASGRQDHTTSPYAAPSFVRALFARLTLPRPPHPAPNVRDDRETPLCVGRDGVSFRVDLGWRRSGIFFQAGLDSQLTDLPVGQSRAGSIDVGGRRRC